MLSKPELFSAVKAFTPNQRTLYEVGLGGSILLVGLVSVYLLAGLSVLLAGSLVSSDLSDEALVAVVIVPGIMSFLFAAASIDRKSRPGMSKKQAMIQAGRLGLRAGLIAGFVVLTIIHFLGHLVMARAVYGPFLQSSDIADYCAAYPALYGLLFAFPVALSTGLFTLYQEVSAQVIYELVASIARRFPSLK